MALAMTDLMPLIGTELHLDADALVSGDYAADIRALLTRRGVVIVRDANLTDDQQRAFTRTLGDLRLGTVAKEGEEGLMLVTMDRAANPGYADYFPGTFFWHMDGTYDPVPPFATVLAPRILSPTGGQTEFANTYAAYEALDDAEKAMLDGLSVVHSMQAAMIFAVPEAPVEQIAQWCGFPTQTHPLVWHHRSGRRSLVVSTSASHVVGMHPAESRALLDRLMRHATQPRFVYRHQWQPGDLLIWDNTGTCHRVLPYDEASGRRLHRFTLNGEEPISAAA